MTQSKAILIVVGFVSLVGVGVWAQTQAPAPQCSLVQKGRFDQGWVEKAQDGSYRCMATYDGNLKLSGAAWVKVNSDGTIGQKLPQ